MTRVVGIIFCCCCCTKLKSVYVEMHTWKALHFSYNHGCNLSDDNKNGIHKQILHIIFVQLLLTIKCCMQNNYYCTCMRQISKNIFFFTMKRQPVCAQLNTFKLYMFSQHRNVAIDFSNGFFSLLRAYLYMCPIAIL